MDNEQLLAAVAAMTSKTDPAEQLGALQALKARADQADAAVAEAQGLRTAIEQRDRAQLVAEGRASGKLTPAMEAWANGQPLAALKSYLEVAPVLVPRGEVKAPELPPDVRHAELAAKGWANLSDADKLRPAPRRVVRPLNLTPLLHTLRARRDPREDTRTWQLPVAPTSSSLRSSPRG